jgi:branched-chain amino acid transport system permease protein
MPSPMQPIERVRAPSILDHGLHLRWSLPLLVLLALFPAIAHGWAKTSTLAWPAAC